MRRYTTASARQNLSAILDAVENGEEVVIERRGVRFVVARAGAPKRVRAKTRSRIEVLAPAILDGQWRWELMGDGSLELDLAAPRVRRSRR
jgi:antitoxin (DNA-binding transcriptional repressor) of toxin-antitoxin stability system